MSVPCEKAPCRERQGASACRKAFRQAACGFRTFQKVLKPWDLNSAGHPSWVYLRAKSRRLCGGCAPKRPCGGSRAHLSFPSSKRFRILDSLKRPAGNGRALLSVLHFSPARSPQEDPLPAPVRPDRADPLGAGDAALQLRVQGVRVRRVHGHQQPAGGLGIVEDVLFT